MLSDIYIKILVIISSFAVHELGHIIAIYVCKGTINDIKPIGVGARIVISNKWFSNKQKILIYALGPCMNIVCAMIVILVSHGKVMTYFMQVNVCIFIINMLPIIPLDGGKLLEIILEKNRGINKSKSMLIRISNICMVLIGILGIIQIIEHRNFSIIIVLGYIKMLINKEGARMTNLMGMERILTRKERFLKKGFYPIRHIAVLSDGVVSDVLRNLDFDSIHIINVLDQNFKLVAVINEDELLNQMIEKGSNITFKDI